MSFRVELPQTFAERLKADSPLVGLWASAGSTTTAEIIAAAGADWVLVDGEHSPYSLETITSLLRSVSGYHHTTPVVRLPICDTVLIKQYLDLGAQNLMVPMVHTAEIAEKAVAAMHYPPRGVRGVGSALARSSRWNSVPGYLKKASETISLTVQIESEEAVDNAAEIAAVGGVDAVFVGPSDLAASMGLLGEQNNPKVTEAVRHTFEAVRAAGKPVGVNAFNLEAAREYLDAGASFTLVGADVQLLAGAARSALDTVKGER